MAVIAVAAMMAAPRHSAQQTCQRDLTEGCFASVKFDLAFIIDRSGSIALRGQTYNAEIEGVVRALRDRTVIPRDGSIAVSVWTFAETATLRVAFTEIDSDAKAESIANSVAGLKCASIGSQIDPCPLGGTSYSSAIQLANNHMSQNRRPGARRVLLISSDGEANDPDRARQEAVEARNAAAVLGIPFEIDVILMGLDAGSEQLEANKAKGNQIISDLPGEVLVINGGECNKPGASPDSPDCARQADEFAELTRDILRNDVAALTFVVNSEADTAPRAALIGNGLSLRQAIERANCNGGKTTITFSDSVKTIRPLVPLPALTQPGIKIVGCSGDGCAPSITIDGTLTDTSKGEQHSDGILIRTNLATVSGLKIINFKRAGVALEPVCPFDAVERNRVEQNIIEDNAVAGVLVLNPKRGAQQVLDESITVRNTISRNAISDSPTLIDLAGDGPTANDPIGDEDEGPNTLLNFPTSLKVVAAGNTVTASGHLDGPTVSGAVVEVFAVTKFSVVTVNQVRTLVINAVSFLASATANSSGDFSMAGVAVSPTGIYTATVTDSLGNTSELMFTNLARGMVQVSTTPVDFGGVQLNTTSVSKSVEVSNTGTAPLSVTGCRLVRCDGNDRDDIARFTISGCPTSIAAGEKVNVNITFTPNACGAARVCLVIDTNDALGQQLPTQISGVGVAAAQAVLTLINGTVIDGQPALEFGKITAPAKQKKVKAKRLRKFTVSNSGCVPLNLAFSVRRVDSNLAADERDDREFFSLRITKIGNCSTAVDTPVDLSGNLVNPVTIPAGGCFEFAVAFNPVIPAVTDCAPGLSAADVLPDEVKSQLIVTQNGVVAVPPVNLVGRISTEVRLIDPDNVGNDPVVTFIRSGDEFTVGFSVYDSNRDIKSATYEFINSSGVLVDSPQTIDLTQEIEQSCIVKGQSFTIRQKFTGALTNRNVVRVRVTVSDGTSSDAATSGQVVTASALSSLRSRGAALSLPRTAPLRSSRKSVPRARPRSQVP